MGGSKGEVSTDHMTFAGRIRDSMIRKGWPVARDGKPIAVIVLRTKWQEFFRGRREAPVPSRPTFYEWLSATKARISPKNLFLLSDLLDVNARWLDLNQGSMSKPISPDDEIQALVDAWKHLSPTGREELLKDATKYLRVQGVTSPAYPFNRK